jgi:hypothetical protein
MQPAHMSARRMAGSLSSRRLLTISSETPRRRSALVSSAAFLFRGYKDSPQQSGNEGQSVWGRLATCAAVGYRRRSAASAAVGRAQGAPPIGRSLPSCPTMPDLPLSVGTPFLMKFRGPKAHPSRPQKEMACPTFSTLFHRLQDASGGHGELQHAGAYGVVDGVGDYGAHGGDRRFAASLRGEARVIDDNGLDLGQP